MGFLTTVREGWRVAINALKSSKVRTGLTILGVAIGVFVVTVMAAVITGINSNLSQALAPQGVTTFWVSHFDWSNVNFGDDFDGPESEFMKNDPLEPRMTRDLSNIPGIYRVSSQVDLDGYEASVGSDEVEISLYGVSSDYLEIGGGDITAGRWFTAVEEERRSMVAIVDSSVAYDLFGQLNPLGRQIRIGRGRSGAMFEIIGLFKAPDNLFAGFESHYVWVPFAAADKALPVWDRMINFVVRPEPGVELQTALDATHARMRQLRALGPGEDDDFALITPDQFMDVWDQLTGVLFAALIGLSSIGLLVGGVGVIGIMMISVTERTREIGLRKSIGARRRDIMLQFLVEASTLTLIGGAAGLFAGGAVAFLMDTFSPVPAVIPLWSVVAALTASAVTGIGFGLYPASRAARLDPIEALRFE